MTRFFQTAAVAVMLIAGQAAVAEAQISVIVAPGSKQTPSAAQIADIFAGVTTSWPDGTKVQIVDLTDAEASKQFYGKVVKRPVTMVRAQWQKLALSGQAAAPKKAADAAAAKDAVKKDPGSIGFIPSADVDGSVKELLKVD